MFSCQGCVFIIMFTCASSCFCVTLSEAWQSINTFFTSFSLFYKRLKEKGKKWRIKRKTIAQWMNLHWNNNFMRLPFLCEKTWSHTTSATGLHSWLASRQNSSEFWKFEIIHWMKYSTFHYVLKRYGTIIDVPLHFDEFFTTLRLIWIYRILDAIFCINSYY